MYSAHFRSEAHPLHWMFVGKDPLKGTIAGRAIYLFEFETIADRRRMEQMFNHMTRATPSLGSSGTLFQRISYDPHEQLSYKSCDMTRLLLISPIKS